jgi:ribosomal protein L11
MEFCKATTLGQAGRDVVQWSSRFCRPFLHLRDQDPRTVLLEKRLRSPKGQRSNRDEVERSRRPRWKRSEIKDAGLERGYLKAAVRIIERTARSMGLEIGS